MRMREAACMVEEGRSHRQDVDPGLWPADLTDRDREAFVRALSTRDDDDVLLPQDSEGKPFPE